MDGDNEEGAGDPEGSQAVASARAERDVVSQCKPAPGSQPGRA